MRIDGRIFKSPSFQLCLFEEGWSLDFFGLFIPLPIRQRKTPEEIMESWGVVFYERTFHLNWGNYTKVVRLPWCWEHYSHEVLREDGSWVPYVGVFETDKKPDGRHIQEFDYTYVLESGDVQIRLAKVYVERMEWRWLVAKWLPWPRIKRQSIDVEFNDEVGERTGSWKGGTIGCGYEMLPGETAEQTLRRMENERKF